MTDIATASRSTRRTVSRWWRRQAAQKALLMAGVAAVGVYVIGDVASGLLYDGYSFANQAISELSAFGSPERPLMVTVILVHGVLLVVFGFGVLDAADRPSLRWVGILLVASGVIGFPTHTAWAMSSRGTDTGFNDTMHIALTVVFTLLVGAAVVLSAVAYSGWFRAYAIATLAALAGFGAAASFAMRGLDQNDTPGVGVFERLNAYAYFAWIVVLAFTMMRRRVGTTSRA